MRLYLQNAMSRTPEDIQDELLVLQCQEGDRAAFRSLITRWQPRLRRLAWRLTSERETARDVVQDAWLAIVRGLGRLDDPARFRSWAYRIVSNKCADWTRRRVVQRKVSEVLQRVAASTQTDASCETDSPSDLGRLRDALAELPDQQRATLDEAARKATRYMVDYLVAEYRLTRYDAYVLCSLAGDLQIAEVVDVPHVHVAMHMPKSVLSRR